MSYFGGGFGSLRPQDLLSTDWFVFIVVFAITYAASYFSLSKVFYKKQQRELADIVVKGTKYKHVTASAANVIAICIGLIVAAAATRADIFNSYLGDSFTGFLMIGVGVVILFLLLPFYKAIVVNLGAMPGTVVFMAAVWGALKFGINYTDFIYYISFEAQEVLEVVTSGAGLVVAIIIGIIFSAIFKKQIMSSAMKRLRRK